ncbi:hypothetical protein chiPu_0004686 [Chiloscyllium punctatum]|uniref:Uncharacterized protein n=1 Tax=Chiloscyllium punctatum TaxID=137246 RepID=A0A401S7C0_CHIPU|nr:hypothetical protein [Chiloscyllium punctatum]
MEGRKWEYAKFKNERGTKGRLRFSVAARLRMAPIWVLGLLLPGFFLCQSDASLADSVEAIGLVERALSPEVDSNSVEINGLQKRIEGLPCGKPPPLKNGRWTIRGRGAIYKCNSGFELLYIMDQEVSKVKLDQPDQLALKVTMDNRVILAGRVAMEWTGHQVHQGLLEDLVVLDGQDARDHVVIQVKKV